MDVIGDAFDFSLLQDHDSKNSSDTVTNGDDMQYDVTFSQEGDSANVEDPFSNFLSMASEDAKRDSSHLQDMFPSVPQLQVADNATVGIEPLGQLLAGSDQALLQPSAPPNGGLMEDWNDDVFAVPPIPTTPLLKQSHQLPVQQSFNPILQPQQSLHAAPQQQQQQPQTQPRPATQLRPVLTVPFQQLPMRGTPSGLSATSPAALPLALPATPSLPVPRVASPQPGPARKLPSASKRRVNSPQPRSSNSGVIDLTSTTPAVTHNHVENTTPSSAAATVAAVAPSPFSASSPYSGLTSSTGVTTKIEPPAAKRAKTEPLGEPSYASAAEAVAAATFGANGIPAYMTAHVKPEIKYAIAPSNNFTMTSAKPVIVNLPPSAFSHIKPEGEEFRPSSMTKNEITVAPWNILDLTDDDPTPAKPEAESTAQETVEIDDDDGAEGDEIRYCELMSRIVGVQYFRGEAKPFAKVYIVRDPLNDYDPLTFTVKNTSNGVIGTIVPEHSAILAPMVDNNTIRIEGSLTADVSNAFALPVILNVYGIPQHETIVISYLQGRVTMRWVRMLNAITAKPDATSHNDLMSRGEFIEPSKALEALFTDLQEHQSQLPMCEPSQHMLTDLLPYQKQGLYWMQSRENPGVPVPNHKLLFWEAVHTENKQKPTVYYNHATKAYVAHPPYIARGGILADDMGLGKTIQTISLITLDLEQRRKESRSAAGRGPMEYKSRLARPVSLGEKDQDDDSLPQPRNTFGSSAAASPNPREEERVKPSNCTLIVCPVSVVGNWIKQFETHVDRGFISVYVFHGNNRTSDVNELLRHDVIITTYSLLASEYIEPEKEKEAHYSKMTDRSRQGALQQIHWLRIILDEAHTIKSRRTKQSLAACQLRAERRWCLTGTPIQNELDDLYSLIKFLHLKPFEDHFWWQKLISKPLLQPDAHGTGENYSILRELIKDICLRRVKTMEIAGAPLLPPRNVYLHKIKFQEYERERYDILEEESRSLMANFIKDNSLSENYAHVLVILTRLRQLCDHPTLCPAQTDTNKSSSSSGMNDTKRQQLLNILSDNEIEDCSICQRELKNPVITPCAHLFCRSCIDRMFQMNDLCPVCRSKISRNDLISSGNNHDDDNGFGVSSSSSFYDDPPKKISKKQNLAALEKIASSAKTEALLEFLEASRQKDLTLKSVIFSQWTSMLDIVEVFLNRRHFRFTRLDGQMPRKTRDENISRFESDPSVTVMLISLKCGSLGLNLTAASQVFLVDPWWNPSTEDQAIDRVHRIGQKRDVNVIRFVVENSIEERVITLQEKKRQLMDQAFGKGRNESSKEQRIEDLKALLDMK